MQDRTMVKNLLQYMTDKVLTSSPEFAAALEHFSITTTWQGETPRGFDERDRAFFVDVFSPDAPTGERHTFSSKEEADAFAAERREETGAQEKTPLRTALNELARQDSEMLSDVTEDNSRRASVGAMAVLAFLDNENADEWDPLSVMTDLAADLWHLINILSEAGLLESSVWSDNPFERGLRHFEAECLGCDF